VGRPGTYESEFAQFGFTLKTVLRKTKRRLPILETKATLVEEFSLIRSQQEAHAMHTAGAASPIFIG
jgi:hypothetical protein